MSLFESIATGFRFMMFAGTGMWDFTQAGFLRAAKSFTPGALDVDLGGKIAIVTGANSGLGKETARGIAERGATVLMVCRNPKTGEAARSELIEATSNPNIVLEVVDVSRPAQIQAFAEKFNKTYDRLDILVNNAGVLLNERKETPDGIETTFATNTLGVYLMTKLLMPSLLKTSGIRVINVSSGGMYVARMDLRDLQWKTRAYDGPVVYAHTKRHEVELATWFSNKHPNVLFYSTHPGWAETPGVDSSLPGFASSMKGRLRTASQGADTIVWASVAEEVPKVADGNGKLLFDRRAVSAHLPLSGTATEPDVVDALVAECESIAEQVFSAAAQNKSS